MELDLKRVIDQVGKDKGISREVLVDTLQKALVTAARRKYGMEREIEAQYNESTGQIELFEFKTVVAGPQCRPSEVVLEEARRHDSDVEEGDQIGLRLDTAEFGRIAAQTAKQVIIQEVRNAERELVHSEYRDRKGEIIHGVVRRIEKGNLIVDLGRAEGIVTRKEQVPREIFRVNERIRAYVLDVLRESKGPQIILSRACTEFLVKLFEQEVPEMYEGIVRIEAAAREPGARSKIGVSSRDPDVDPIGACVGVRGSRVQAVVQELRGEKIDIVPFDRDPARYVIAAIQPAEVHKVIVDEADGRMELVVPDEKLSLAIGRKGQNVRLAAQLTGWKLDIISETKFKQMEEEAINALQQIDLVTDVIAKSMYRLGFRALEEVSEASIEELAAIPGLGGAEAAERIKAQADTTMERLRQERIKGAASKIEELTDRERLHFIRGIGERTIVLLEEAG